MRASKDAVGTIPKTLNVYRYEQDLTDFKTGKSKKHFFGYVVRSECQSKTGERLAGVKVRGPNGTFVTAHCDVDQKIPNDPVESIEIMNLETGYKTLTYQVKWENLIVDFKHEEMLDCILNTTIDKGVIKGPFRWVISNGKYYLVRTDSEKYKSIKEKEDRFFEGKKLKIDRIENIQTIKFGDIITTGSQYLQHKMYLGQMKFNNDQILYIFGHYDFSDSERFSISLFDEPGIQKLLEQNKFYFHDQYKNKFKKFQEFQEKAKTNLETKYQSVILNNKKNISLNQKSFNVDVYEIVQNVGMTKAYTGPTINSSYYCQNYITLLQFVNNFDLKKYEIEIEIERQKRINDSNSFNYGLRYSKSKVEYINKTIEENKKYVTELLNSSENIIPKYYEFGLLRNCTFIK